MLAGLIFHKPASILLQKMLAKFELIKQLLKQLLKELVKELDCFSSSSGVHALNLLVKLSLLLAMLECQQHVYVS